MEESYEVYSFLAAMTDIAELYAMRRIDQRWMYVQASLGRLE